MTVPAAGHRAALWLPLLRQLTETFPRWAVWKNVESALAGHGDVDSFAPPADWPAIEQVFLGWIRTNGLGPAIVCRHIPQGPHFVTWEDHSPYLLQLDVKRLGTFRGSALIDVADLARLSELDGRGFRRIRPGAEGVLKLVYNGLKPGGRRNPAGLAAKRVVELLEQDPEGIRLAARLFGPAAPALKAGVPAVLRGGWNRPAMLAVEAWALGRSPAQPRELAGRLWLNLVGKKRCPVLQVIRERDRLLPEDREAWLRDVAATHVVRGWPVAAPA
ncbi:MAG: hypothetical protein ABR559_00795 [Gemmatimonadota bacterium]